MAQDLFDFHSGFWLNLHHFLFEQASAGTPPDAVAPTWDAAVDYYRKQVIPHDLLSDEAALVNQRLSLLESGDWRDEGISTELASILQAAAPLYRERWWPEHDRGNRAWIAAAGPLISAHGEALKNEFIRIYGTPWPAEPIRTDVAEYTNWAGAYTTLDPAHITISSTNPAYRGAAALEMVFHEASHALVGNLSNTLDTEARAQNKLYRRNDFWHAILFYTAGEMVRRRMESYVPYADKNGLYTRVWQGLPEILNRDWKPYLDGEIDSTTAVRRLVQTYGVAQ
jgi:hypothetical protein